MASVDGFLSVFRSHQRELVCGYCASVMAWIDLRPFRHPRVYHVNGSTVLPMGEGMARRITQTRLASAREALADPLFVRDPDLPCFIEHSERQLDYLSRQCGEPVYELLCTNCGANYLRSMPHLSAQVRRSAISRVSVR